MKKYLIVLVSFVLVVVMAFVITGCASIVAGGPSVLNVNTVPKDVKVTIVGLGNGETLSQNTPCIFTLNKNSDYKVTLEYQGYKSEEMVIRRGINGWFWGNILFGGIVGMVIDGVTQNMWDHNLHALNIEMQKISETGVLPDKIVVDYPVTVTHEDGSTSVVYMPINFYRQI